MAENVIVQLGKTIDQASIAALNRAARTTVTAASKLIRQWFAVKKKDLDYRMKIVNRARQSHPYVTVRILKGGIPLHDFNARQIGKSGRSKKNKGPRTSHGVKATVKRGNRKLYRSADKTRGSFIATMKSGHTGAFIRKSNEKDSKIVELFGLDISQLIDPKSGKSKVIEFMQTVFQAEYEKRLDHELRRRLK